MNIINKFFDGTISKIQPNKNICFFMLKYIFFIIVVGLIVDVSISVDYQIKMLFLSIVFIAVLFFSYDKNFKNKITRFKIILILLFISLGICFLFNGIILKSNGYILYSMIYILIIPCFLIIKINWECNIKAFISGVYVSNWLFVIVSFIIAPINRTPGGYTSLVGNQNYLSALLSVFFICLLIYNYINKGIFCKILIAVNLLFLILTQSRTGILVCSISFVIYILYLYKRKVLNKKDIVHSLVVFILAILASLAVFYFITPNTYSYFEKNFSTVIKNINYVDDYDIKFSDSFLEKMGKGILNSKGRLTSGRSEIWNEYIKHIEFKGHKKETIEVYDNGIIQERDAHNSILQISYSGGILAGVILSLIFLLFFVFSIKNLINIRRINIFNIFIIMIGFSYLITSMFSSIYVPMSGLMSFCFYIFIGSLDYER